MTQILLRLRDELGIAGFAALALIATVAILHAALVSPMQARNAELQGRVAAAPRGEAGGATASTAQKVGAVYEFLGKGDQTTDWLAKLHAIGAATGVHMKSANYRTRETEGRIVRYEMVLPVSGSYAQIRDFLNRSAAEIPVMSIDHLSLKRESRKDAALQAEIRLTLHLVKS